MTASSAIGAVDHLVFVVDDIPAAAERWGATAGAGPFFLLPSTEFDELTHAGEPARFAHDAAFGRWGAIAVELQQVSEVRPRSLEERLLPTAGTMTQAAYRARDLAHEAERLEAAGCPQLLHARGGPIELSVHHAPALAFCLAPHQQNDFLTWFYAMLQEAGGGWDGSDALREMPRP